ncbi:hypothetical protein [Frigidibacter sp. MR17.24]|uniref:hypothetical protein n=1 Tax=Frigidibacter sp. MR17.24 TaxID=3127345 RepID=UPI0030129E90
MIALLSSLLFFSATAFFLDDEDEADHKDDQDETEADTDTADDDAEAEAAAAKAGSGERIRVLSHRHTGQVVGEEMFGANVIYGVNTEGGQVTENFEEALDKLDVDYLRFPSGKGDGVDPEDEGKDWLDVTDIDYDSAGNPHLNAEAQAFLDWASGDANDGEGYQVKLVVPTKSIPLDEYQDYSRQIEDFAYLVGRDYPDTVAVFEIGNEYYIDMPETEYGQKAGIAAKALADGLERAGLDEDEQPQILVQVANVSSASEFSRALDSRGYVDRITDANQRIIDQLDDESRDAIDGVVGHYYLHTEGRSIDQMSSKDNLLSTKYEVWQKNFDKPLDLHVTEWNTSLHDPSKGGLASAQMMLTQVDTMVSMGASSADVWPVQHNTHNDLAGGSDDEVETDAQGHVTNTVNGMVFDLMAEALPGSERIELDLSSESDDYGVMAYESDTTSTIYVFSKTDEPLDLDFDFSELVGRYTSAYGLLVGIDEDNARTDGIQYSGGNEQVAADHVTVDGEAYYYNENDAAPEATRFAVRSPRLSLSLDPYEFVQLTFRH